MKRSMKTKASKVIQKISAFCVLLIGSSYVYASKFSDWKDEHAQGEASAFLDAAFWVSMIAGVIFIVASGLAWKNLTSGNPSQKVQQMGGVGIGVGFLIGGMFLALTWFIGFVVGTVTGEEDTDDAFQELRSGSYYEYRIENEDDQAV